LSLVRIALFLLSGLFLVLGPLNAPGDGDLYWQRWLGGRILQTHQLPASLGSETFTAPGAPWVPQEWLFSVAVAIASHQHLFILLAAALSMVPFAVLVTIWYRSRGQASPEATAIAITLCGIAMLESFGTRAQVLGWAALALFMLFIERRDRWYYAALPTAICWANLHASVALAPVIVLGRIGATVASKGLRGLRSSRDLLMLAGVAAAMFCTPLGVRLPSFALALVNSPIRHYITEWQPPSWHDASFLFGALPLALAIVVGGRTTLLQTKLQSFPAAILLAAALFAFRNTALFAIVAAPLAARGLDAFFPRIRTAGERMRELEPAALVAIGLALVLSAVALVRIQSLEPARLPTAAMATLAGDHSGHRVFCEDFSWCSIALGYPDLRVFIDGRADAYPLWTWREYAATIKATGTWSTTLRDRGVDAVVSQRGSPLALALRRQPHWGTAYQDAGYVLFRRD